MQKKQKTKLLHNKNTRVFIIRARCVLTANTNTKQYKTNTKQIQNRIIYL